MPSIHLELDTITLSQQRAVDRGQIVDDRIKAFPEICAADADAGEHPLLDESMKDRADLKSMTLNASGHGEIQVQRVEIRRGMGS